MEGITSTTQDSNEQLGQNKPLEEIVVNDSEKVSEENAAENKQEEEKAPNQQKQEKEKIKAKSTTAEKVATENITFTKTVPLHQKKYYEDIIEQQKRTIEKLRKEIFNLKKSN